MFSGVYWNQAVRQSVQVSVCVQNTSFCQSAGGVIKSHLVTALVESFENTVRKGDIASYNQFLLFPQCFLPFLKTFCHFHQIQNFCLQTFSLSKSLKFVVWERVKCVSKLRFLSER